MNPSRAARADSVLLALFALFLFSSTFSIALSQASLGLALAVFIGIMVSRRESPFAGPLRSLYAVIGLYVLWILVSSLAGSTPLRSVLMEREDWLFAVIPITVYLFQTARHRDWLLRALIAGVLMMALYGVIQHFTGLHWPKAGPPPRALAGGYFVEGTFAHHLTYGNYFAIAACFGLTYALLIKGQWLASERGVITAAALLAVVATVLSYARTAVAAIPVTLLFSAGLRGWRWFATALAALVVAAAAALLWVPGVAGSYRAALDRDFAGQSQAARVFIWTKTLGVIAEHPLFGVGQGNFPEAYREQNDPARGENRSWPHAHNDVLNIAALSGIPGALIYMAMWVLVALRFFRGWKGLRPGSTGRALVGAAMAGSLMFALCSVTEAAFADEEVRQFLMFVWGAGLSATLATPGDNAVRENTLDEQGVVC